MDITYIPGTDISLKIVVNGAQDITKIYHYIYYIIDNQTNERIGKMEIYQSDDLNEFLYCGNVAIELKEEYRYKGYATKVFELAKVVLRILGFDKVTLTCEVSNEASAKSMEKNKATYIGKRYVPEDNFAYADDFKEIKVYEYDLNINDNESIHKI